MCTVVQTGTEAAGLFSIICVGLHLRVHNDLKQYLFTKSKYINFSQRFNFVRVHTVLGVLSSVASDNGWVRKQQI